MSYKKYFSNLLRFILMCIIKIGVAWCITVFYHLIKEVHQILWYTDCTKATLLLVLPLAFLLVLVIHYNFNIFLNKFARFEFLFSWFCIRFWRILCTEDLAYALLRWKLTHQHLDSYCFVWFEWKMIQM
jgi:hypothetical protein